MKKIFNVILWTLFSCSVLMLLAFVNTERNEVKCSSVNINILPFDQFFIETNDIHRIIKNTNDEFKGRFISSLNFEEVEKLLEANPYISNAEVYSNITGQISVDIKQTQPILRIFDRHGTSFYMNKDGSVFPLSNKYTSRVLVVTGNIPSLLHEYGINMIEFNKMITNVNNHNSVNNERTMLINTFKQLHMLATFINEDKFWKAQIEHVYVTNDKEFELIPRVGNHRIVLGNVEDIEEKFNKLMFFYKDAVNVVDCNEYRTINLKFKDQIICTKNLMNYSALGK